MFESVAHYKTKTNLVAKTGQGVEGPGKAPRLPGAQRRETGQLTAVEAIRARGTIIRRLRFKKCGKDTCRCAAGDLHGPYWYAQWTGLDGKVRTRYVGKVWTDKKVEDLL